MTVELLHYTPLHIASAAIRKCWASEDKSDTYESCPNCGYNTTTLVSDDGRYFCPDCDLEIPDIVRNITTGEKDKALIDRVGNKMQHESVKNHITYNFNFEGITTKTLLALTRHDIGVEFSVQSTRFTTKKSVKNSSAGYTKSKNDFINESLERVLVDIKEAVRLNIDNDEISMLLPQAWRYNLICSMSMTAVQHFIKLREKKEAHWDIQDLAEKIYYALPDEHKYLFEYNKEEK